MRTFFAWVMIIIALILAILGVTFSVSHSNHLPKIILITSLFDFMIPVLAVAALINYLWKSCTCCYKEHHE